MKQVSISQVDALFANGIYPIEFLFYFKKGLDTKRMRKALKKLSAVFWPIFGEYREGSIFFDSYDENDFLIMESVDRNFTIPATEKEKLALYGRYSPPDTKKLSAFKIMLFKNGMTLVPKMKHLAGDGYSYFYFLSALAALTHRTLIPHKSSVLQMLAKPHHHRTALKKFTWTGPDLNPTKQFNHFTTGVEEISRKDVQSLIRRVSETNNFRISTNDVLSAAAVKMLAKAQKQWKDTSIDLTIPIDVRRWVKDYGKRFFGNGIRLHKMSLERENVDKLPIEELAIFVRKRMPSISRQSYVEYLTRLDEIISLGKTEKFRPFDPASGCLVTNISRLPVDKLNFGKGGPDLIYPLTIEKNAAAILVKDENFVLRYAH
jgi:hypothetical protein